MKNVWEGNKTIDAWTKGAKVKIAEDAPQVPFASLDRKSWSKKSAKKPDLQSGKKKKIFFKALVLDHAPPRTDAENGSATILEWAT